MGATSASERLRARGLHCITDILRRTAVADAIELAKVRPYMRIALLTTGRFWLVDLGRELAALGHDVRVYSLVPPGRTRRFGLPAECNRWLGPHVAPLYLSSRYAPTERLRRVAEHALFRALDELTAQVVEPCDVVVAMSGIFVRSLDRIKRRHGATVFLERASRHILSQRAILEAIAGADEPVPAYAVDRELAGYALADFVTVPAMHVADSFRDAGFSDAKLFRNPFGVALDTFQPTFAPSADRPTILMTGTWSLRKGCDVLVEAWRKLPGVRLLHVGPVADAPLPADALFEHVDSVPQSALPAFYARAHMFALASREEGLALVQVQALACGLKIVCTTRTGGADLAELAGRDDVVTAVPPDDPDSLAEAMARALDEAPPAGAVRDLLGSRRDVFSWSAYARRYAAKMAAAR